MAKASDEGVYYSVEDGNQLFQITHSGSSCMRVDKGQLFDGLSVHQGVFSLTAAAGGDLYGIDTVNNSLLKIDPDAGSMLVIDEDPLSLSTALVHGLAYRPVPPPVPVPVGVPWPALAVPLLAAALIGHAVGNRNSRARRSRSP